jgi:phosphoribosylanthranilate isomerase
MSARTRIKICGVTRPADAVAAARAGADAIGLVFYPKSRRVVSPATAHQIIRALPAFVMPVGLFVDQPFDDVRLISETLGLRCIQLHGHETPGAVALLAPFAVLKVIRADRATLANELAQWRAVLRAGLSNLIGLVLETPADASSVPGGTGVENDWATIADLQRAGAFDGLPPIIAAGGLRPDNVRGVIERLRPWAVDVSSGVEGATVGEKSAERIDAFVAEVRRADRAPLHVAPGSP